MKNKPSETSGYSDEEIARRRDELAKRMLNMPPKPLKPHSEMKLGKRKAKANHKVPPTGNGDTPGVDKK
jgi:hypothetical protein